MSRSKQSLCYCGNSKNKKYGDYCSYECKRDRWKKRRCKGEYPGKKNDPCGMEEFLDERHKETVLEAMKCGEVPNKAYIMSLTEKLNKKDWDWVIKNYRLFLLNRGQTEEQVQVALNPLPPKGTMEDIIERKLILGKDFWIREGKILYEKPIEKQRSLKDLGLDPNKYKGECWDDNPTNENFINIKAIKKSK